MSMLTRHAEKLTGYANELAMLSDAVLAPTIPNSTKEQTYITMRAAACEMRNASETIASLRDGAIENVRLRNLCREIWMTARLMDANKHIEGMRLLNERGRELEDIMCKLGVISEHERLSGHIEDDRPTQARLC